MLQQTPVHRVTPVFDKFIKKFPTPQKMAKSTLSDVIVMWDRLGYPRRARNLYATSIIISENGWPEPHDYEMLPGVGAYTARALRAITDDFNIDAETFPRDCNITRVCDRVLGEVASDVSEQLRAYKRLTKSMHSRDACLAVMDLGALICTKRSPSCDQCPIARSCAAKGALVGEVISRQKRYEGSFRQKRGDLLAQLREGPVALSTADTNALESLVKEGFVQINRKRAFLADALVSN
jgi:A/G-specific adenine glycosylase